MTRNQIESHHEQMEAVRRDFDDWWKRQLRPSIKHQIDAKLNDRDYAILQMICFQSFVEGRKKR